MDCEVMTVASSGWQVQKQESVGPGSTWWAEESTTRSFAQCVIQLYEILTDLEKKVV